MVSFDFLKQMLRMCHQKSYHHNHFLCLTEYEHGNGAKLEVMIGKIYIMGVSNLYYR